jgi:hypothetical protein
MKKIGLLVLLFSYCLTSWAQDAPLRFGLKLNPIVSMLRHTDEDKRVVPGISRKGNLGFSGGLMMDYFFSEQAALHTGLHIVNRGYRLKFKEEGGNAPKDFTVRSTVVEVPLQLKMRSGELAEGFRIRGLFGGALGLNVAANTEFKQGSDSETRKGLEGYNVIVPDFVTGLGVEYQIKDIGTIDFGISYHYGLMRFATRKSEQGRAFINYLGFDLGFYF